MKKLFLGLSTLALSTTPMVASAAVTIDFMCVKSNYCDVIDQALQGFYKTNPDIKVKINQTPYNVIKTALPARLAAGEGPDMATIADGPGTAKYLLNLTPYVDEKRWETDYANYLPWFRAMGVNTGVYGLQIDGSSTGAFVNKTLFEQAGVPLPGKGATWEDWAAATKKVAKATGAPYPMAIDRSGHRIAGGLISYGAKIFDANGKVMIADEGYEKFVRQFVAWHKDGTMAKNVWMGKGGTSYQDAWKEFYNAKLVFYYAGSWGIGRIQRNVGDAFDWATVPAPCGPATCTDMPAGMAIVGLKHTKHKEAVAKVIDYLSQRDTQSFILAGDTRIPSNSTLAKQGVPYKNVTPAVGDAIKIFSDKLATMSPIAHKYQAHRHVHSIHNISLKRISQALVGEVTVDQAMDLIREDVKKLNSQ